MKGRALSASFISARRSRGFALFVPESVGDFVRSMLHRESYFSDPIPVHAGNGSGDADCSRDKCGRIKDGSGDAASTGFDLLVIERKAAALNSPKLDE